MKEFLDKVPETQMDDICDDSSLSQLLTSLAWLGFPVFLDPQESHLGAEVDPISDVGEEVFRVTGGAGCHTGPVHHHVVMDVLRQDPALFQENSVVGN